MNRPTPYKQRWWLPALLCLTIPTVQAAPSLAELIQSALQRNPGEELSDAHIGQADALASRAGQLLANVPTVNLRYQDDRIGSDMGYREWEGGVELPLWLPGQSASYAREAELTRDLAQAMRQARRLRIAGEVRERLWGAATAQAGAAQASAARDTAKSLADDVQRRVAAGELPRSDRLLAEKAMLMREQALQQALSRTAQADALLERYTGSNDAQQPQFEVPAKAREISEQHPQLLLARAQLDRARAHRKRTRHTAQSGPSLWLGGKSSRPLRGGQYESSVGVEISIPLGERAYRASELAEAETLLTEARLENERTRLQLQETLVQAQIALDRQRVIAAQGDRRRALAEQSLKLSRRAFELGETDLVRLLQAQDDALAARYDYQLEQLQLGLAIARFNQALGVMPQ